MRKLGASWVGVPDPVSSLEGVGSPLHQRARLLYAEHQLGMETDGLVGEAALWGWVGGTEHWPALACCWVQG